MALQLLRDGDEIEVSDVDLVGDDGDKDVSYRIRKMTPEKQRDLIKRNTRAGNHRRPEYINWPAVQDDQIDYLLVSWKGVKDGSSLAECSRENKLLLDGVRKTALIDRAGMSELVAAEEARQQAKFSA